MIASPDHKLSDAFSRWGWTHGTMIRLEGDDSTARQCAEHLEFSGYVALAVPTSVKPFVRTIFTSAPAAEARQTIAQTPFVDRVTSYLAL